MDLASGLFALGGVALAGGLAELRAWRESRSKKSTTLFELRRETYARAIRQMETVASKSMRYLAASDKTAAEQDFWEAATAAYETLNEIRLISVTQKVPDAYKGMIGIYRRVVNEHLAQQPDPMTERIELVDLYRQDLGVN